MTTGECLLGDARIRTTPDSPPKASLIDVIGIVTGKNADYAAQILRNIISRNPEVSEGITDFKFPGRGQRDTPVADARTLWSVICLLPGQAAAVFRQKSGDVMVRYLGGDETLINEIRGNQSAQAVLAHHDPSNPFRIFARTVEAEKSPPPEETSDSLTSAFKKAELESLLSQTEERRAKTSEQLMKNEESLMKLKRQRLAFIEEIYGTMELDDRDRVLFKDAKRTCIRSMIGPTSLPLLEAAQPGSSQLAIEDAPPRELSLTDIAVAHKKPHRNADLQRYGVTAKRLYFAKYNKTPPKRDQFVDGAVHSVNCYFETDRDLLERAVLGT